VRGTEDQEHAMAEALKKSIAVVGIDISKNSFRVVGLDECGAIVLQQKWSRGQGATNESTARGERVFGRNGFTRLTHCLASGSGTEYYRTGSPLFGTRLPVLPKRFGAAK
jgi:hypothetical protein